MPKDVQKPTAPAAPKQKLVILSEFCTRAAGANCERCAYCCPKDAISLPKGQVAPIVNHTLCNGCGICFGVCDSFASTRMSMFDLHARIRRIAQSGQRTYLTCKENVFPGFEVDNHVVVLPCLSMMSPELWTLILAEGIRVTIACDLKYCEDCERGGELGGELFSHAIQVAEVRTGEKVLFTFRIPEKQKLLEKYAENNTTERRAMFEGFAADAANIATGKRRLRNSSVLKDYYERKERQRAAMRLHLASENPYENFTPDGYSKRLMFPKQQMILEAVEASPSIAENIALAISETDLQVCMGSMSCIQSCPTGARFRNNDSTELDARLCIGCGICVDACEQAAIQIVERTAEIYADAKLQPEPQENPE